MQEFKAGTTVLILDHLWHAGKKAQVISATSNTVLVEVNDFFQRKTIQLAPEQLAVLDQIEPTEDGPFHTDDIVFLHESIYGEARDQGQVGRVIRVFPAWQKCLVKLESSGEEEEENSRLYTFDTLSLMVPERRPPDEDYLRAIAHAIPRRGYWQHYNDWWQQQADKKLWPIDELPTLYAASLEIEAQANQEIATEIERQSHLLEQAFADLTHAQKVEKWQAEWYSWIEYRSYNNESTVEERLLRAIFGEEEDKHTEQEDQPETPPEDHGQDYGYRNSGPELLERCEKYMKRLAQAGGYAYDTIPFRTVTSKAATDIPLTISYPPTLPQTALQPVEPLILPEREQALALLKEEGDHFTAAQTSLAIAADDAAVAALQEKYSALQAREGFDNLRYHHISNLALALLATQREEAINTVLKKELDSKFWGDSNTYSIQGVLFKGSAQALFWDENNPWHIRSDEAVQTAIAHIWSPVIDYAPRFVALLSEYTAGLVLFKHKETGGYYLGYLHLVPLASYELSKYDIKPSIPGDTSINHLVEWLDQGHLCLLLGHPPRDPDNDSLEHLPTFRLPLALRELYAIHSGLDSAGGYILDPPQRIHRLLSWIDEKDNYLLNRFHARNLALLPDQFVGFAPDGFGNTYVFDLDCLDERNDPQVADWDHETWKISKREPFWQWFADFAPRSLLGLNEGNYNPA